MITILSLALEMQSFVSVSAHTIEKAKASDITTENSTELATLVDDWGTGHYDEDPDYMVTEIESLLK